MSTAANQLLHRIVSRLPHTTEAAAADFHADVDASIPLDEPEPTEAVQEMADDPGAPAADTTTTTDTTKKG